MTMTTTPFAFLYQTRTILKSRRWLVSPVRALHTTSRCQRARDNDIPFARDASENEVAAEEEAPPRGTITPTERQAFERIFADIAARGLKPRPNHDLPPPDSARRTTNLILQRAATDAGMRPFKTDDNVQKLPGALGDKDEALLRFPPSLRAAASKAFELLHPDDRYVREHPRQFNDQSGNINVAGEHEESAQRHGMRTVDLDKERNPEQQRVEDLLSAAKTDFELWDIMEKEVFSYPEKLGLQKQQNSHDDAQGEKKSKVAKAEKHRVTHASDISASTGSGFDDITAESTSIDQKLNLYVYGPLYPSFLLLGLRLLDKAFARSSPLALSVLPRIKELGLESFVLGVSTPFYNELLQIYYRRHGDLSKMLDLLEEMRQSGLLFDEGTAAVLKDAHEQVRALAAGKHGGFGKAFMTMPEYERSLRDRLRQWLEGVDISIQRRNEPIGHQTFRSV